MRKTTFTRQINCLTLKNLSFSPQKPIIFLNQVIIKSTKVHCLFKILTCMIYETLTPLKQVVISYKGNLEVFVHRQLVVISGLNIVFLCNGEKFYV